MFLAPAEKVNRPCKLYRLINGDSLALGQSEQFTHLAVEKSFTGTIRLNPFAIDHKLRDGALAGIANDLFGGAGSDLDVDQLIGDLMFVKEALGFAAVAAPRCRID